MQIQMKERIYQSPQMKVVSVQHDACICNESTYENHIDVSNNDINPGQDDVWSSDLDW